MSGLSSAGLLVSLREDLAAFTRQRAAAIVIVLLVAAGAAYGFKRTPPTYQDRASLVLVQVQSLRDANPYISPFAQSMINTGELMVKWLTGPEGRQELNLAGAESSFSATLINFSDQEYPYYGEPYLTVTGAGHSLAEAHRVLVNGVQVFNSELTSLQSQAGVPPDTRITTYLAGDTGPMLQAGSSLRVYAGLGILTIAAGAALANFLDRHPSLLAFVFRLSGRIRRRIRLVNASPNVPADSD